MFFLELEMILKIREKRARKRLTLELASKEIGISSKTLSSIESEKKSMVKKGVYEKLVNWLINDKFEVK